MNSAFHQFANVATINTITGYGGYGHDYVYYQVGRKVENNTIRIMRDVGIKVNDLMNDLSTQDWQ